MNCWSRKNVIIISSMGFRYTPSLLLIIETFGITNKQILTVFKELFQRLNGLRISSIEMKMKNAKYLLTFYWMFFEDLISHKTQKFEYKTLNWMNRLITLSLKKYEIYQQILCWSNRLYQRDATSLNKQIHKINCWSKR